MGKGFDLKSLLSNKSLEQNSGIRAAFDQELIDIDSLQPDGRNFYSVDDVQDLIDSISLVGLEQNLVVRKDGDRNAYIIISGHRRWKALRYLVDEGREEFRMVPCKVSSEHGQIDAIITELRLIFGNATSRRLSDYEQTQQVMRMKELLRALKDNGVKIPGRLQSLIADTLKTSKSRVGRMENIAGNLAPEFQEEFKSGGINMSVANELSGMPQDQQRDAYAQYKEKGRITISEVKQHKTTTQIERPAVPPQDTAKEAMSPQVPPDTSEETAPEEKILACAYCGSVIEGQWYKCFDSFMRHDYFSRPDESDNVFCSPDCFCKSMILEAMNGGDAP